MKKLVFLLITVAVVALVPAGVSAHTADHPDIVKLMAGQTIYAGNVEIWNDGANLHIRYVAKSGDGFCLKDTHLHVADDLDEIPQKNGNPIPGHFAYGDDDLGCVHDIEYVIPLDGWGVGTPLFIAAHAVVGDLYDPYFEETGWGVRCGNFDLWGFEGARWAAYILYIVQ